MSNQRRRWSDWELSFLPLYFGRMTMKEIAGELDRSERAIEAMAIKMGLRSKLRGNGKPPRLSGSSHPLWREPGVPYEVAHASTVMVKDHDGKIRGYARYLWEQHYGPIPDGHCIYHRDGNWRNCDINNLECISRGQLANRNANPEALREAIERDRIRLKYGLPQLTKIPIKRY